MRQYKLKIIVITFSIIGIFLIPNLAYADTNIKLSTPQINPDSPLYPLKRATEKFLFSFQFTSNSKLTYQKELLQIRLAELKYIAENHLLGQVETSSQRFAYQVGTLIDFVKANKLDNQKKQILYTVTNYKPVLEKLRDEYKANSSYWLLLQQDIDSIGLNLEKIK